MISLLLLGLYQQDCLRGHQRVQEFFPAAEVVFRETSFADPLCSRPQAEAKSYGRYEVGAALGDGGREMDFFFSRVTLVPLSREMAASFEEKRLCGLEGWRAGEERDVSGLLCELLPGHPFPVPRKGAARYGIVKEEADDLYFGRLTPEKNGLDPSRRPTELDPRPYRKTL